MSAIDEAHKYVREVAKRGRQAKPTRIETGPERRRTPRGSIERMGQRVSDARTNVNAAMAGAAGRGPVVSQLDQAARDWRLEAERIERELAVTALLNGDSRKQAMKILRARVVELEAVADKLVDTAFTEGLAPAGAELDRLRHASDRLDALQAARAELDRAHADPAPRLTMRVLRIRTPMPGRSRH